MPISVLKLLVSSLVVVIVAGCVNTRTVAWNDDQAKQPDLIGRTVEARSDRALYSQAPACVVVLPPATEDQQTTADPFVEEMVARHLSGRVNGVIGPLERNRLTRQLALDLSSPGDEITLARQSGCSHVVQTTVMSTNSVYAVVWTREAVGLHLALRKAGSDAVLWEARHIATRSDGGLPLSPLSALVSIASAGLMAGDDEVRPSLTDDALRRIVATLADFRTGGGSALSTSAIARRYGFE